MSLPWTVVSAARGLSALGPHAGPQAHYILSLSRSLHSLQRVLCFCLPIPPTPVLLTSGAHAAGSSATVQCQSPQRCGGRQSTGERATQGEVRPGSWCPRVWVAPQRPSAEPPVLPNMLRPPTGKKGASLGGGAGGLRHCSPRPLTTLSSGPLWGTLPIFHGSLPSFSAAPTLPAVRVCSEWPPGPSPSAWTMGRRTWHERWRPPTRHSPSHPRSSAPRLSGSHG